MKKNIHQEYYENCKVTCACGNSFVTGSTLKEIRVELCNKCHPFYTGKQKFVDTARRVEKFKERVGKKEAFSALRKSQKAKKTSAVPAKKTAAKKTSTKKTAKKTA